MQNKKTKLYMLIERIIKEESSANNEYVIWGVPPGKNEEQLLLSKIEGKVITDPDIANKLKNVLETKHQCTKIRIQKVNMSDGDFSSFGKSIKK